MLLQLPVSHHPHFPNHITGIPRLAALILAMGLLLPFSGTAFAAPPPLDAAEVTNWCRAACVAPVKPAEMTRTVTGQKMVGGRLATVSSEVPTAEGKQYQNDLAAFQGLTGPEGAGGCEARCSCAVLATQNSLKGLKPAVLVKAMAKAKGAETWETCACKQNCGQTGTCGFNAGVCVALSDEDCAASDVCQSAGRCTHRVERCVSANDIACLEHPDCAAQGLCTFISDRCLPGPRDCARALVCKNEGACTTYPSSCGYKPGTKKDGFVLLPPGTFVMGSPTNEDDRDSDEQQHKVTVTRGFWMQIHEVTQAEYTALMGPNPSRFAGCNRCPVENVSWFDAIAYANKLSAKHGLESCYDGNRFKGLDCRGYRLPTEAEWEYAARAGTTSARYGELNTIAWYEDNSGGKTHPVGTKQPNAWGLYDMLGNVWEWVHDWYGNYPQGTSTDPIGPDSGSDRVFRGGSWRDNAGRARATNRLWPSPVDRFDFLGFRLSRSNP